MNACYSCGRQIVETAKAVAVLIVESHSGRIGSAHLHAECCCVPNLVRYRKVIEWDGATVGNLTAFKRLHGRIAAINSSASGSVPILLA
jgi:hypothetical protein